jgi:GTPase SAR1 family protein
MDSFESISHWIEFADKNAPPNAIKILIGNKSDQEKDRAVDTRCGKVPFKTFTLKCSI